MFPLGFWNHAPLARCNADWVQEWADCGMTLPMSPVITASPDHPAQMRAILDAAAARGMKVILYHDELFSGRLQSQGEAPYRAAFARALAVYGDHPATFGFYIGDEPDTAAFAAFCQATRIQREMAPHLTPFGNLLPLHPNAAQRVGYLDWCAYLDAYATVAQAPLLCYDYYGQLLPDAERHPEGFDLYFRNLNLFRAAAQRHGVPFWTTLLSTGVFHYRCPTEDDFRWQLNTAIAHGAKGLLWFFLYMREPHSNYRVPPIDEHYERTATFGWLSRVNRTFLKTVAPLCEVLTLCHVWHVGQAWGDTPLLAGDGTVAKAEGGNLVVSEFRHPAGATYIAVVNNSQTAPSEAKVWVRGRQPRLHHVCWGGEEVPFAGQTGHDWARFHHWLAPGQLEFFRIAEPPGT